MREHIGLYRGKRIDNGEWVEGSFLQCGEAHRPLDRPDIQFSDCYIVPKTDLDIVRLVGANVIGLDIWAYHVDPNTVGECTGLRDKNGKLIYEGDCVEIQYNDHTGEKYVSRRTVSYDPNHGRWYPLCWGEECDFCDAYTEIQSIEVVGNPELLKGGKDDG